eukprot:51020-Eustigmatos_ZCMA.PRE.1
MSEEQKSEGRPKPTLGEVILKGYYELEKRCIERVGKSILPPIETVEVTDIVVLISTYFSKCYESQDYLPTLSMYAAFMGVTAEQLEVVYPDAQKFITETLTLLKSKTG